MEKNVLITGASSGIGRQTALYLSELGYHVVLVARNKEKLEQVEKELTNKSYVVPFDLTQLERIEEIFVFCKEQGIKLDGMVHCAGITTNLPIRANNIDTMKNVMTLHYFSFVELGKYFCNRKYSNDGSSIVAISSLSAQNCYKGIGNYAASKNAVNTMVTVMAKEFIKRKIRVNSIMPAYVKTPMTEHTGDFNDIESQQPYGFIEPEYIAYMIEYLLSDKAKYITGAHIPISAGMEF